MIQSSVTQGTTLGYVHESFILTAPTDNTNSIIRSRLINLVVNTVPKLNMRTIISDLAIILFFDSGVSGFGFQCPGHSGVRRTIGGGLLACGRSVPVSVFVRLFFFLFVLQMGAEVAMCRGVLFLY